MTGRSRIRGGETLHRELHETECQWTIEYFRVRDLVKRYTCKPTWKDFVTFFFRMKQVPKKDEVITIGKERVAIG